MVVPTKTRHQARRFEAERMQKKNRRHGRKVCSVHQHQATRPVEHSYIYMYILHSFKYILAILFQKKESIRNQCSFDHADSAQCWVTDT